MKTFKRAYSRKVGIRGYNCMRRSQAQQGLNVSMWVVMRLEWHIKMTSKREGLRSYKADGEAL